MAAARSNYSLKFHRTAADDRGPFRCLSILLCFVVFACQTKSASAAERTFVILCSPALSKAERSELFVEFQRLAVEKMGAGDRCQIFDGIALQPVADFTMPKEGATQKSRMRAATPLFQQIQKFLNGSGGEGRMVHLPQFTSVFAQMVNASGARVLVIGSPLYRDDTPANNMTQGWLGDGYLTQPASVSLFSTAGKQNHLRGAKVNYCTLTDDLWDTENKSAHREMTQRFWALYIQGCGGTLVSFQPSLSVAFQTLASNAERPVDDYKLDTAEKELIIHRSKIVMGPAGEQQSPPEPRIQETVTKASVIDLAAPENAWITKSSPALEQKLGTKLPASGPMKIALTWEGAGIDLDLHVSPQPGSEELYFDHPKTREGVLHKDFASALPLHGFELVEFNGDVRPAEVSVWVNAFQGESKRGFAGEVRVLYAGAVRTFPVKIAAKHGNGGKDILTRQNSPCWARIDLNALQNMGR